MRNFYLSMSCHSFFVKLIFSGLLTLILAACSSASDSSDSNPSAAKSPELKFSSSTITVEYVPGFSFTTKNLINISNNIDLGQLSFESDKTSVVAVDSSSGIIKHLKGAGTTTITVTRAPDNSHNGELTANFLLTVEKGNQSALVFNQSSLTISYVPNSTQSNIIVSRR